jgi:hypothetical protein
MPTHVVAVRAGIHPRVVAPIYTRALDANNRGQIVGDYGTPPTGKPDPTPGDPGPTLDATHAGT